MILDPSAPWTDDPTCCPAPALEFDRRLRTHFGPTSERVMRCKGCDAAWLEETTTVGGWDGADDREFVRFRRCTDAEVAARRI